MEAKDSKRVYRVLVTDIHKFLEVGIYVSAKAKLDVELTNLENKLLVHATIVSHEMKEWALLSTKGRDAVKTRLNVSDGQFRTLLYKLKQKEVLNQFNIMPAYMFFDISSVIKIETNED